MTALVVILAFVAIGCLSGLFYLEYKDRQIDKEDHE